MNKLDIKCPNCGNNFTFNSKTKVYYCNKCGTTTILNYDRKYVTNLDKAIEKLKKYFYDGHYYMAHNFAIELLNNYPDNTYIKHVKDKTEQVYVRINAEREYKAVKRRVKYLNDLVDGKTIYDRNYSKYDFYQNYCLVRVYKETYPNDREIEELYNKMEKLYNTRFTPDLLAWFLFGLVFLLILATLIAYLKAGLL